MVTCGVCCTTDADIPATVLAERVGWEGSMTWFRQNVRALPPRIGYRSEPYWSSKPDDGSSEI
jgi:hypothetical protein